MTKSYKHGADARATVIFDVVLALTPRLAANRAGEPNALTAVGCAMLTANRSGYRPARPRWRHLMESEPKTAAELKELRIKRRQDQEIEGVKAMADIAAADVAIRKRTAKLRALRLAKEAADLASAAPPKPKKKKSASSQ